MRIGPVAYSNDEESVLSRGFVVGMLIGVPLGIIANLLLGFPAITQSTLVNIYDRSVAFLRLVSGILAFWWILSGVFSFFFYSRRESLTLSWHNAARVFVFTLLAPCLIVYAILVFCIFFVPLYLFLYPSLSPILISSIGAVLFFPFVYVFIALVLPESKPRRDLCHSVRRFRRSLRK